MSLIDEMSEGSAITGLVFPVVLGEYGGDDGEQEQAEVDGSYTSSFKLGWGRNVQFFEDGSGKNPVRRLAYRRGALNYVGAADIEVISGEFNGCIMAVYQHAGGGWRACHVDTEKDDLGNQPTKDRWTALAAGGGVTVVNQVNTAGCVTGYVESLPQGKQVAASQETKALCVADSSGRMGCFLVQALGKGSYRVLQRTIHPRPAAPP